MRSSVLALVCFAAVVVVVDTGCAECASAFDCGVGNQCVEGVCEPREENALTLVSPTSSVDGETFELVLHARFRGTLATVRVERVDGDPCLPFVAQEQVLAGDDKDLLDQDLVFSGLLSGGAQFKLRAVLTVLGAETPIEFDLAGPPAGDEVGGFAFQTPLEPELDARAGAWQQVTGSVAANNVVAYVEPLGGDGAPTPRRSVGTGIADVDTFVPLVRGPQVIWVEGTTGDVTRRCGRGVVGNPSGDDDGDVEFALLTEGEQGDAWLGVSVRFVDDTGVEVICDAARGDAHCAAVLDSAGPKPHNVDIVHVDARDAIIEVAAVPRAVSGPVTAWLRVSSAGAHAGFFGPFTLFPSEGQAWFAGRVVVEAGLVSALVAVDDVSIGSPW